MSSTAETINKKLQQEEEWLRNFSASVKKSAQLRENMVDLIEKFEQRLSSLEQNVLPMHETNGRLQIKQHNIQRLINTIDATIQFYGKTSLLENKIRDGCHSHNIAEYLENMEALQQAILFFEAQPNYVSKAENMKITLETGFAMLEKEYKKYLQRNTIQGDPVVLMDILDEQYELIPSRIGELKTIKDMDSLIKLSVWLLSKGQTKFLNNFSEIRGDSMYRTVTAVLGHHHNITSTNISVSRSTAFKTAIKKKDFPERKETISISGPEEGALLLLGSLLALLEVEEEIMKKSIPDTSKRAQVFREVVSKPLAYVVRHVQEVVRDSQGGVVPLLPLIRFLAAHQTRLHNLSTNSILDIPFESLIRNIRVKGSADINDFVENLRSDTHKLIPVDGNVHPITASTLNFLMTLTTYRHVVTQQLLSVTAQSGENQALLLPKLFARILSALGTSLKRKAENYDDPTLSTLFLLNNYQYIAKTLADGEGVLLPVISEQNTQILSFYEDQISKCIAQYMTSWNSTLATLNGVERITVADDRSGAKSLISNFTREFDQVCAIQRTYCISDTKLVEDVRDRVRQTLIPPYSSLVDRMWMSGGALDRPPKYSADGLATAISKLFDVTAS